MNKFKNDEERIYGINACLKAFEKRKEQIIRLAIDPKLKKKFSLLIEYCVKNKKAYHFLTSEELEKITKTQHHEGVSLLLKERITLDFSSCLKKVKDKAIILYLKDVNNPHNLGAILRTAAHFGVHAVLIETDQRQKLSGSIYRTSEGGAESVDIFLSTNFTKELELLKKNKFNFCATSSHQGDSLYSLPLPHKSVLIMGNESTGIDAKSALWVNRWVSIPGTQNVESLNVGVATAIILSKWYELNS